MKAEERKKLSKYGKALGGLKRQLSELKSTYTDGATGDEIVSLQQEIQASFPGLVPAIDKRKMFYMGGESWYCYTAPLIAWMNRALATIEAEIEETNGTSGGASPVTQKKDFSFISDIGLQAILERDCEEAQRAYIANCDKSTIVLCGGIIEALLLDMLREKDNEARKCKAAEKGPIDSWGLNSLIEVSRELELVGAGVEKFSHSLRQFRNLIHPGKELRDKLKFGRPEAAIALEVLNIVHRDISSR